MRNGIVAVVAGVAFALGAHAQDTYPSKPIRIIVGYSPGGGVDAVTRVLAKFLGEAFRKPVVVENRPGADGRVGAEYVAKSAPDGHTLLLAPDNLYTIIPHLYADTAFNALRDIEPVVLVCEAALVIAAGPDVPANSLADMIRLAKASPGTLSYGSSGNASVHRFAAESLQRLAGIRLIHVPYKGTSAGAQDLAGGQIQFLFGQLPSIQPLVQSGRAKILAVTTEKRFALSPDIPSVRETVNDWSGISAAQGLLAPKGLAPAVAEKLNREINRIEQDKEFQDRLAAAGMVPAGGTQAEYKARLARSSEAFGRVIRDAGIKGE